ncbi:MAG: hypothetical protein ABI397_01980 [Candidatus Saccharimonas sp.]
MNKLTSQRSAADENAYIAYKKTHSNFCSFCELDKSASKLIKDYGIFMIVSNAFPYATWDRGKVTEHIMLTPKRHVESLSLFTDDELKEFATLLAKYESIGYNFYGRSYGSEFKSIKHQHTHLIKTEMSS